MTHQEIGIRTNDRGNVNGYIPPEYITLMNVLNPPSPALRLRRELMRKLSLCSYTRGRIDGTKSNDMERRKRLTTREREMKREIVETEIALNRCDPGYAVKFPGGYFHRRDVFEMMELEHYLCDGLQQHEIRLMSNHAIQEEELRNRNLSRLPNAGYDPNEARDNKGMWAKIDETARKYNGNTSWAKGVKKDNFPPNTHKCNKFVFDVLKELGIKVEIHGRPPLAAEWADKNTKIPGWRVLKSDETPQPGDVAAYKESGGGMGYSGHVGFIISDGKGGISNISAHDNNVAPKDGQFDPKIDTHKIVFRRYVGK